MRVAKLILLLACALPLFGAEFQVGDKFKYQMTQDQQTPHYTVYNLSYPSPDPDKTFGDITARYYLPADLAAGAKDQKPRPAVLVLHILGGNGQLSNMFCANLASKGIPALMFYMPTISFRCPGGSRDAMLKRPDGGKLFVQALELSLQEVSRSIDLMQSRPEINPDKISLIGTSMGGIIGATALAHEPRIDKAILLLAGGNIDKVIGYSRETAEMRKAVDNASPEVAQALRKLDPLYGAEKLKPMAEAGRLVMFNAENDEVVPMECTMEFAGKAGMKEKVQILPGLGHYTAIAGLPQILAEFAAFLADDTVPKVEPPAPSNDQAVIRSVFRQLSRLLRMTPDEGYCFYIDTDFTYRENDDVVAKGALAVIRGTGNQFKVLLRSEKLPLKVGNLFMGYDQSPWVVSNAGSTYRGSIDPEGKCAADFFDPRVQLYRDMAAGIFDMAALGMLEPLKQFCSLTLTKDENGNRQVEVVIEKKEFIYISLKPGTEIPTKLTYKSRKASGEINFRQWMLDAPADPQLFAPEAPKGGKVTEVSERDLNRVIAASVNFLIEGASK